MLALDLHCRVPQQRTCASGQCASGQSAQSPRAHHGRVVLIHLGARDGAHQLGVHVLGEGQPRRQLAEGVKVQRVLLVGALLQALRYLQRRQPRLLI